MMKTLKAFIASLFIIVFSPAAKAQITTPSCQDSTIISGNYCNNEQYDPVCGCDNVTYQKICSAAANGILYYTLGPCEAIDFHIFANPVAESCSLLVATKDVYDVNLWIFDSFARERFYQLLPSVYPSTLGGGFIYNLQVDTRGWGNGVYFVVMRAGGTVKVKRLLVNQVNP